MLFTVVNTLKLVVVLFLTIYLIVFKHMGIEGIYLAQVIGNLLFILILSGYTLKNCTPFFKMTLFKSMSSYGFPLLLANFAAASLTAIDRYSLNSLALMKYVAIYTMAYKLSSVLKLVIVDSVKMAITPMVLQKIDAPDNQRFYSKTLLYSSFVLMLGIITISFFLWSLKSSRSRPNSGALLVAPVLSLSALYQYARPCYGLLINKRQIVGMNVVIQAC
jgi:O-antigen/teichoic acid export membrane protein